MGDALKLRNRFRCKPLLTLLKDSRGSEIAEAAVVLPLVFLFIFAILWFGLAFNTWGTVTSAAREGARYASRPTCATCGPPANNYSTTNLPGDVAVDNAVVSFLQTARVDPSKISSTYTGLDPSYLAPCASPPSPPWHQSKTAHNIYIYRFVVINAIGGTTNTPQQCGMIVAFQYPFGSGIPFPTYPNFSLQQVNITAAGSSQAQN